MAQAPGACTHQIGVPHTVFCGGKQLSHTFSNSSTNVAKITFSVQAIELSQGPMEQIV